MTNDEYLGAKALAHDHLLSVLCGLYLAEVPGSKPGALQLLKEPLAVPPPESDSLDALRAEANASLAEIVSMAERIALEIRNTRQPSAPPN